MLILLVLLLTGAAVGVAFLARRAAYRQAIESRGWTYDTNPNVLVTRGLNLPPFGTGTQRRADDHIVGRSLTGVPFHAFEYDSTTYRCNKTYVVVCPLPHSMPEFYLMPPGVQNREHVRAGITATLFGDQPLLQVGHDQAFVQAATQALLPIITRLPAGVLPNVSIDHASIVFLGLPHEPDALAPCIEVVAAAAQRLAQPDFAGFTGEPVPAELGVHGRPGWVYRARDDSMLAQVRHDGGGQNHRAVDIFMDPSGPLPFINLVHHWETTRIETYTDGEGRTKTRTVTDHHQETITEFHPQFRFGDFSVNQGIFGRGIKFESHDFNQRFKVKCRDARFAYDLFHPRMMEFMLAANPPGFGLSDGRLDIDCRADPDSLAGAQRFLLDFFARVPNFVWENLGHQRPPVPLFSASAASAPSALPPASAPSALPPAPGMPG